MVKISKKKAKRLGIKDEDRLSLTKSQLTKAETKSGQYDVKDGKTFLKRDEPRQHPKPTEKKVTTAPTIHLTPKEEPKSMRQKALEEHPKLTRGLETSAVVLGTIAAGLAAYGLATIPTAIAMGTRVGSITHTASIHHWSKQTGMLVAKKGITLSRSPILEKAGRIGGTGVDKLFKAGARVAVNQKTTALAVSELSKSFSTKAMAIYGTWAGSVFLGKWAQAEAPEPITIPLRDALRQAQETGDYSIYDEYHEAAEEISNMSMWETILSYSPVSAIPGILNKMKGVKKGIDLIDAIAEKAKEEEARKAELEPEPTFTEQRETARQTQLEERARDAEYYRLIREGKFEEAEELLQSELK